MGGGGGAYSYIPILPDESLEIKKNFKKIRRAEREYINMHPPPPPPLINTLASCGSGDILCWMFVEIK